MRSLRIFFPQKIILYIQYIFLVGSTDAWVRKRTFILKSSTMLKMYWGLVLSLRPVEKLYLLIVIKVNDLSTMNVKTGSNLIFRSLRPCYTHAPLSLRSSCRGHRQSASQPPKHAKQAEVCRSSFQINSNVTVLLHIWCLYALWHATKKKFAN